MFTLELNVAPLLPLLNHFLKFESLFFHIYVRNTQRQLVGDYLIIMATFYVECQNKTIIAKQQQCQRALPS